MLGVLVICKDTSHPQRVGHSQADAHFSLSVLNMTGEFVKKSLWIGYCGSLLLAPTGCTSNEGSGLDGLPPPPALVQSGLDEKQSTFESGDSLELFVKEDETLGGSYLVREGGYIVIPRAGRISVAGMGRSEAENKVKESLQASQLTEATVLVERTPRRTRIGPGASVADLPKIMVFVTGAVPKPAAHQIPIRDRPPGLYEVLLLTGGMSRFANEQRVEVLRTDALGKRHRAVVDVKAIQLGERDDPVIGEGDIIHVPERLFGL